MAASHPYMPTFSRGVFLHASHHQRPLQHALPPLKLTIMQAAIFYLHTQQANVPFMPEVSGDLHTSGALIYLTQLVHNLSFYEQQVVTPW